MKHKGRFFLTFLLALAMVLGLVPGMSLTAYAASSGTLGSATYTIDDNGVLTVGRGSFTKEEWQAIFLTTSPFGIPTGAKDIAKTITKVVFDDGATATDNATAGMFYGWKALQEADLSKLDTSAVTNMWSMFKGCVKLVSVDLSGLITANVTSMNQMFKDCVSLQALNVSNFDTSKVTTMASMFDYCSSLKTLDLSSFDTQNCSDFTYMFNECGKLTTIIVGETWTTKKQLNWSLIFRFCTNLVGGNGTKYVNPSGKEQAIIDGTDGQPGLLTAINKANAVSATVTANNRIYDGTDKPLVTVTGEPTGGEMQYALGTATEATQPYTTSIPTATNAGTYYVWYKVIGDADHNDTEAANISVTISLANTAPTNPSAETLNYTGAAQPLVTGGSVTGDELQYALGTDATNAPGDGWSTDIPTAAEPGTYYVWYRVVGDANHNDVAPVCVVVTIEAPAEIVAPAPEEIASVSDYTLLATMKASGKKALKLSWTKVADAEGYDVFFGPCGGEYALKTTVTGRSCKIGKLKKGMGYKAYVRAWKTVNGAKTYIGQPSPSVHAIAGGKSNRYTNPKKITVKKKKLSLKAGTSKKIKASVKKLSSSRRYLNHTAKIRYYSSNRGVATVDANGRVSAVGSGSCTVYALAENGLRVGVKITVK